MGVLGGAGDARGAVPLRAPRAALGTGVFDSEKVLGLNPWPFSFPPCLSEEQFSKGCYLGMVNSDSQSNQEFNNEQEFTHSHDAADVTCGN